MIYLSLTKQICFVLLSRHFAEFTSKDKFEMLFLLIAYFTPVSRCKGTTFIRID